MEFRRDEIKRIAETDRKHSAAYYAVMIKLFDKLIKKTEHAVLFSHLEDWWSYSYSVSSDGGFVELEHHGSVSFDENGSIIFDETDQSFVVAKVPCRLLTVEEYAQLYQVETGTVRQWIRRGKIRTAKKFGNEWRIPELTEIPSRGYKFGQYKWEDDLTDVPDEYEFLRQPAIASFSQDRDDTKLFHVNIERLNKPSEDMTLSAPEREKLELFLIAHPMVRYLTSLELYG